MIKTKSAPGKCYQHKPEANHKTRLGRDLMAEKQSTHTQAEQWRPVLGYEGYYEVSDRGNVRSVDRIIRRSDGKLKKFRGKTLKPFVRKDGRVAVALCTPELGQRTKRVHHLVLEAFVGERPEGTECCHWDDDSTNNRLENLRWDTSSANKFDMIRNNGTHQTRKTHCPRGHEYSPDNILLQSTGRGRNCRTCNSLRHRARRRGMKLDEYLAIATATPESVAEAKKARDKEMEE